MSAGFWMDLQLRWDLHHDQDQKDLESIGPYAAATSHYPAPQHQGDPEISIVSTEFH